MRDVLLTRVTNREGLVHTCSNTNEAMNEVPQYDMLTSTKVMTLPEVPLASNRDKVHILPGKENDYTDGKWWPLLPPQVVKEMIQTSPKEHKERWELFLFEVHGPTPLNCMPRCTDPNEVDNIVYKTTKMKRQNERLSIAGQVIYDVTREQLLIKKLAKGVAGSIHEKGRWGVTD